MIEQENEELESCIAALRKGATKPVDLEKSRQLEEEYASAQKVYNVRKKQFKDLWNAITENYDGNKAELWVGFLVAEAIRLTPS